MIKDKLRKILPLVTRPARYTGGELNAVVKDWDKVSVTMLFAFPDVYEVGMSHLGGRILYHIVNSQPDMLMERTFAPWPDMEDKMREEGIPLYSLESFRPAADFDIIGFSLQYELSYSNVLNMLDLAGIPLLSAQRGEYHPLVIAGGPNTFNPEPMADFIDIFVIGEAEEVLPELLRICARNKGKGRQAVLAAAGALRGIYVPAFYEVDYNADGTVARRRTLQPGVPDKIKKALVKNLDEAPFPDRPVVPYLEIIHDRAALEIMRGCQRGCRFCQAGIIYRPVRERSLDKLEEQARQIIANTGFDEISLASLSSADYTGIASLTRRLVDEHGPAGVGVALPSLRVDAFSVDLARQVQRVRKTTLTFAPEAGSQRLRDVINKNVREDDILSAVKAAFASGWLGIKLYFMVGLPTETDEDLEAIIRLVRKIKQIGKECSPRPPRIHITLSYFVPKPHTPFQWAAQINREEMLRRKQFILEKGRMKNVEYDFHDPDTSFLEGVLARGDRRLGKALYKAWEKGARFDGWHEHFKLERYLEALGECGLDPEFYTSRQRPEHEILPWDFIDTGVDRDFLWIEYERAMRAEPTPDCREGGCQNCGICPAFEVDLDLKGDKQHAHEG